MLGLCYTRTNKQNLQDVEQDKAETESPGLDAIYSSCGGEIIHHSTNYHVAKGVRPQGGHLHTSVRALNSMRGSHYQDEGKVHRVHRYRLWILHTQYSKDIRSTLPNAAHDDDPAVTFSINDGLDNVNHGRYREKDSQNICGTLIGADCPDNIWVASIWVRSQLIMRCEKR